MTQQDDTDVMISRDPEMYSPMAIERDAPVPPDASGDTEFAVRQPQVELAPEGHISLVLPAGGVVTGTMAAAAAMEVKRLAGTSKLPMLLVLTGVEALTRGARTVFSNADSMQAVAVLGVSPVDRVIANFLLGGAVQPCPTRYFSNELDALAWLRRKTSVA